MTAADCATGSVGDASPSTWPRSSSSAVGLEMSWNRATKTLENENKEISGLLREREVTIIRS